MNKSITAIVLRSEDYKDFDKKLKLFCEDGEVMRVIIRGVKRPKAKLKFAAQPFAFCNYELVGRDGAFVVTGAMAIEDLFKVSDYNIFYAGYIMLEASEKVCEIQPNREIFLLLLRRLKTLIYENYDPRIVAISYLQNVIHISGYDYVYDSPKSEPSTVMELLACTKTLTTEFRASDELVKKTFDKISRKFEDKFSCTLISKSSL